MGTAFSGGIRTSRAFSGEIGTPAAFSGGIRTPAAFSGDNRTPHGVLGRQSAIPWVVGQDRYAPRLKTGEMSPDNPSGVQMLPENASDVQMSPDNHPASTHCPATPSASEQSYLKRRRSTNVHASFGSFFFAHRQTPRHQRSKTPGLHEGIMRLPAPGQIDIPITGTNASQALGALEDCPPPIDILELIRRKQERDREALTLHRIGQDPNAHLVAQPFNQIKTDSR